MSDPRFSKPGQVPPSKWSIGSNYDSADFFVSPEPGLYPRNDKQSFQPDQPDTAAGPQPPDLRQVSDVDDTGSGGVPEGQEGTG